MRENTNPNHSDLVSRLLAKAVDELYIGGEQVSYKKVEEGYQFSILLSSGQTFKLFVANTRENILNQDRYYQDYLYPLFTLSWGRQYENKMHFRNRDTAGNQVFNLARICCNRFGITTIKAQDEKKPRESTNSIDMEADEIIKSTIKVATPSEFKVLELEIKKDKEFVQLFNETFEATSPELLPIFKPYIARNSNQDLIYKIRHIWGMMKDEQNDNIIFNLKTICCYLDYLKEIDHNSMKSKFFDRYGSLADDDLDF